MLNMRLLQKAQTYFRKPALPPVIQRQAAAHDEQVGSSRSKRAQIRDVLRQYERGSLKEAEAVEELLRSYAEAYPGPLPLLYSPCSR
jgi:hypothetical protein